MFILRIFYILCTGDFKSSLTQLRSSRKSIEDLTRTTIVVKDIPANLNQGAILRRHFSQFGTVTRVHPVPSKSSANITFEKHVSWSIDLAVICHKFIMITWFNICFSNGWSLLYFLLCRLVARYQLCANSVRCMLLTLQKFSIILSSHTFCKWIYGWNLNEKSLHPLTRK